MPASGADHFDQFQRDRVGRAGWLAQRDISVAALYNELGIQHVTLYRYVGPDGALRRYGKRVLDLA
jgi:hypothetical protein